MEAGTQNVYVCRNQHKLGTAHRETGTTPMFISCPKCGERATSTMGRLKIMQTHGKWVKPTKEEFDEHVRQLLLQFPNYETHPDLSVEQLKKGIQDHLDMGGTIILWDDDPVEVKSIW